MILRLYRLMIQVLCLPIFLSEFLDSKTGKEYGLGFWQKIGILRKMIRNNSKIVSGSTFMEHITMATSILQLPASMEGAVVECGTYKGVSAANLSLICKITSRKLIIFDSFEGLPAPSEQDKAHTLLGPGEIHTYKKGQWCGQLEEVKENITRYGEISVCEFHKGFFDKTLPSFQEKCVFAWADVDYRDSLETCLRYLWPLLSDGGFFYTHEVRHMEIANVFFSEKWWEENLQTEPPGIVGAGTGIGLKILNGPHFNSSLGFTIKNPRKENFRHVPQWGGLKFGLSASLKLTSDDVAEHFDNDHPVSSAPKESS